MALCSLKGRLAHRGITEGRSRQVRRAQLRCNNDKCWSAEPGGISVQPKRHNRFTAGQEGKKGRAVYS